LRLILLSLGFRTDADAPPIVLLGYDTYAILRDEVLRFAAALAAQGLAWGDQGIIDVPMVPEAASARRISS
jgi:acyl-coenzyme A synthetase/AMP-(fatty) acid ligase